MKDGTLRHNYWTTIQIVCFKRANGVNYVFIRGGRAGKGFYVPNTWLIDRGFTTSIGWINSQYHSDYQKNYRLQLLANGSNNFN